MAQQMVGQFRVPSPLDRARLAAAIQKGQRKPKARKTLDNWQAMVLSVDAGSPPTLTIQLGDEEVPEVRYLNSYVPVLGEKVEIFIRSGGDVFVLGALAT